MQEGDHWILGHMDWGTHFPVIVFTAYALVGNSFYIHVHVYTKIYRHTGVNCYWVIDNSKEVLDRLHNINKVSGAKCFDSFDFATLYTNIPHDGLKSNIRNLVREAYKVRGAKYLIVDRHGKAHWSQSPSSVTTCMSIDKSKLVELTEYLIDNVYVKAGNRVYRQTIGIPMGTDCAPQLANLYLFHHEYMYMRALMKSNLHCRYGQTVL